MIEIAILDARGRPRSDLAPGPEKRVALKRRIGMFRRCAVARLFPKRAWLSQG